MPHFIFGLIAIAAGLGGVYAWWADFGQVLRGFVPLALLVVGLVGMGAGLAGRALRAPEEERPPQ